MPIQAVSSTSPVMAGANQENWIIAAGVYVATASYGFYSNYINTTVINYGSLAGVDGVTFSSDSDGSTFTNSAASIVQGSSYGVRCVGNSNAVVNYGAIVGRLGGAVMDGTYGRVLNHGSITSVDAGVMLGNWGALTNAGSILADHLAVRSLAEPGTTVSIDNLGLISGGRASLISRGSEFMTVENSGRILGDIDFIDAAASSIRNTGDIRGDIQFGPANDVYDGRGGALLGEVRGEAGADTLIGGAGEDVLIGGAGKDWLQGGRGEDLFVYELTSDSRGRGSDVIRRWDGGDRIDVTAIDGDTRDNGFQALTFGGEAQPGDPLVRGQLVYVVQGGDTYVMANTDRDAEAEFQVVLIGEFNLNADDFVLR